MAVPESRSITSTLIAAVRVPVVVSTTSTLCGPALSSTLEVASAKATVGTTTVNVSENSEVDRRSGQVAVQVVVAVIMSPAAPAKLCGKDSTPEPVWVILTNEA